MLWRLSVILLASVCAAQEYLLPGDVKPYHYDVRLLYDIDNATNFSYFGVVDIQLTAKKPTSKIVLHGQDFKINQNGVSVKGLNSPQVRSATISDTYNFLTIELDKTLDANANYTLTIPFRGNLVQGLDGPYVSSYVDSNTKNREYLVATQFESISARKGFPCFDEPMYKSSFTLTLGHNHDYSAVSNMPQVNSTDENVIEDHWPWSQIEETVKKDASQFAWAHFERSVPMSTYLVAFVISKFGYVTSPPGLSRVEFRIWARQDAVNQTTYASTIGPKVLTHFEKFFNVSFPLPKQDMIAIPDFSAGAMENWGLVTYRETALLYDREQSSYMNKERVAEVIAHELAHQWFGNLVTMKWWSDLWLNEGFATFVASIGVHEVEPTWQANVNYAVENLQSILNLDSLQSSHPVSVPIDDPKRINEIFDEISYKKGSTLIRMMTMFLGENVFRKALHNYLVKYSYKNAAQDDLWQELTATSRVYGGLTRNLTVKQVMDTWTTQAGYPLLTVTRDYTDNSLTVSQKRYLNLGVKAETSVSWWIPLSVMCESDAGKPAEPVQWLATDEGVTDKKAISGPQSHSLQYSNSIQTGGSRTKVNVKVEIKNNFKVKSHSINHRFEHAAKANEWVLFNHDMIAPYRVNYDARNWQLLAATLASPQYTRIPTLGRVQLLSDAFALAWTEQLHYSTALQIANYLQRETEYLPLKYGLHALDHIDGVLQRSEDYGALQKFVRSLIGRQYEQAGGLAGRARGSEQDMNSVKMQTLTAHWACKSMYPGCEESAVQLYREWMDMADPDNNNPIPLDLRRTVYCVAVRRGGVREWRFLLARQQAANVAAAKDHALYGLSCTREIWILRQYLEWAITDNTMVRRQDSARVMALVASTPVGYYVGKEFVYTRIQDIYNAFQSQSRRIGIVVKTILAQFTTQRELDEFLTWKDKNMQYLEEAKLSVAQGIEAATVNIEWLKRNKKVVVDKLREYSS